MLILENLSYYFYLTLLTFNYFIILLNYFLQYIKCKFIAKNNNMIFFVLFSMENTFSKLYII